MEDSNNMVVLKKYRFICQKMVSLKKSQPKMLANI